MARLTREFVLNIIQGERSRLIHKAEAVWEFDARTLLMWHICTWTCDEDDDALA